MEQVLQQIGWPLRGSSLQRRGPCPIHATKDDRHRCFSVHLGKQIFQCFDADCAAQGNALDLWAKWRRLPLYEAAIDLAQTFNLDPYGNREEEPVSPPHKPR